MPTIQKTKVYAQIEQAVRAGYTNISLQGSARASKTYNTIIWLKLFLLDIKTFKQSDIQHQLRWRHCCSGQSSLHNDVLIAYPEPSYAD